jgi:membrane fusion protein (multidrug efflux system)
MAENPVKLRRIGPEPAPAPESEPVPPAPPPAPAAPPRDEQAPGFPRRSRVPTRTLVRWTLLTVGPLVAIVIGLHLYLAGGRYVTTDNAYVKADTLSVSTDVAGPVAEIAVRNNQRVEAGQLLFRIDDEPYRIQLAKDQAYLAQTRNDTAALQATYRGRVADIRQAESDASYYEREYNRQAELLQRNYAPQAKVDEARRALDAARQRIASLQAQARNTLSQLGGDADQPVENQPNVRMAQAVVDKSQRDLRRTAVYAPMAGIVTNVDKLQVGQQLSAGQAAFSLVAVDQPWVEANPKETDLTWVKAGDRATITVDTYPDRVWTGRVASLSPATGAEFSVLPAQNASGNWVKVVQRVPVRIAVDVPPDAPPLRAGMSAQISIDTGRKRTLADLGETLARFVGF